MFLVRKLSVVVVILALISIASCGENSTDTPTTIQDQQMSDQEVQIVISQLLTGDTTRFEALHSTQQEQVAQTIIEQRIYPDESVDPTIGGTPLMKRSLPDCGGYWTSYWVYESIEERNNTSGLLYETGPNCCMQAPGDDCGTDHDDYMLSFYFGRHNESIGQLSSMLKWTSSSWWVRALLGSLSARLYQQTPQNGPDNYDVKICIDDYFYLTLRRSACGNTRDASVSGMLGALIFFRSPIFIPNQKPPLRGGLVILIP